MQWALASGAVFVLLGAGNAANDFFDASIDAINRPGRPLPSGQLSEGTALVASVVLSLLGLALAFQVSHEAFAVALVVVALSYSYSCKLKRIPFVGNVVVSFLSAMTVLYGGMVAGYMKPVILPAVIIFVSMLWREIVKTVDDYDGDLRAGARTLPTIIGKQTTLHLSCFFAWLTIVAWSVPYILQDDSAPNRFLMFAFAYPTLVAATVLVVWKPTEASIRMVLRSTKVLFFVWLLAMFLR